MGRVCHLMLEPPSTLCGVNTREKKGAGWSDNPDVVTCQNCLKLLNGGQMGAPPPTYKGDDWSYESPTQIEKIPVDLDRLALSNNLNMLESMKNRLYSFTMDLRVVMSFVHPGQNLSYLCEFDDYLDMAKERLNWAVEDLRTLLKGDVSNGEEIEHDTY